MSENPNPCVGCIFNEAVYRKDLDPPGNLSDDLGYATNPIIHRCKVFGHIIDSSSQATLCLSRQSKC